MALPIAAQSAEIEVDAFNTYSVPPFIATAGRGLDMELVDYLNRKLQGSYRFKLSVLPRERLLKRHLNPPQQFVGLALFMAPQFVDDVAQQRFLWSPSLFDDQNMLIFRGAQRGRVQRLDDLKGLRFGGVLGYRYEGFDGMVAAGSLVKETAGSAQASLRQVCLGRVDFTQMSRVMFEALAAESGCADRLVLQPLPHSSPFGRRIMMGRADTELAARVSEIVEQMPCDREWRRVAAGHRISLPACRGGMRGT
ncbi:substrate-binding periplasmic protein [Roseateles sp.]|uniref:substrate-binding periplasmic protein n=1 Tax=Roseateles sp. TaxID=1971397 RepID=UPI0039EB3370